MSDVIKSVLGLVVNKARSATASHLSDGDLTDERIREAIMSGIDDIKSSIRGLSRQPLNSSLSFLKEGISEIGLAVRQKSASTENVETAMTQAVEEFVAGASASQSQQTKQRSANKALSLSDFEIVSQERWVSAKESFKMSREQATIAFGNTALSIEDRIVASKLRIVSRILEKFLDDPKAGAQDCLLYLRELHDLPAIRQMFTVHLDGGFKSFFKATKRSELVESITVINDILFDFILNFTGMIHSRSFKWPVVQLTNSERNEHIFVSEYKIKRKVKEEEDKKRIKTMRKRWPNVEFHTKVACRQHPYAVNSTGRIYCTDFLRKEHHDEQDDEYLRVEIVSVDIGPNDDILYALEFLVDLENGIEYLRLKVFDLERKSLRVITKGLPPPENTRSNLWAMRVLENKIVLYNERREVFVLTWSDTQDQLNQICSFSLPSSSRENPQQHRCVTKSRQVAVTPSSHSVKVSQILRRELFMCVTNKREVIIARYDDKEVYICPITEEGQMEGIIPVPLEKHETEPAVRGVAFDATHEEDIIVLRSSRNLDSKHQIEVYSRNGDTLGLYPLPGCWSVDSNDYYLLSNPKGIVAFVEGGSREFAFWNLVGKVFVKDIAIVSRTVH